ncbi:DUF4157 domain-containing protein [Streptomyces sp. NPDC047070]|uniref:eCIS core domain-containing protein n=1 Tax=Streptomyces sp. NPDC047070 TaxID=3154923 RepID=UPI003453EE10
MADNSPAGQKALLDAAMASPSRSLPDSLLAEATPFFQNPNLSATQLHDNPVAQRATTALGAQAMTVGTHIFASPEVVTNKKVMGHELSHVNENLKGIRETGNSNGAGVTVTDPNQGSERKADRDGVSFGAGASAAPSVVTQRTATQDADRAAGHGTAPTAGGAVQRMESPPRGRRNGEGYEADASASDSSPERRELHNRIEQELAGGTDLDDLVGQTDRLNVDGPNFRRIRAVHPSGPAAYQSSESDSDAPGTTTAGPAQEQLPELPEHTLLTPLHDLLTRELHKGGAHKKLKVTFKVDQGSPELQSAGGHAWIEITGSKGKPVSFGFYPDSRDYQRLFGSVQGGVHCPDGYSSSGRATHHESKQVALKDIIAGYHLVHGKALADYSFTTHNCSTFAGDVWQAMTGQTLPRNWLTVHGMLSTVVANPYAYGQGLESHQEERYQNRLERMRPLAEGPMRALIPGPGDADEVADRMARAKYSQSSSSQSSEEVD